MEPFLYSTQPPADVVKSLESSREKGLSAEVVRTRQHTYGYNEIEGETVTWWQIFLRQLKSPFVYLLLVASLIAFLGTGDLVEGGLILLIVLANSFLGFFQEYKASQTLEFLKTFVVSHEKVLRDGQRVLVPTRELVPGDIVFLEPGDKIPADLRLIEAQGAFVDESIMTGESIAVAKTTDALSAMPKQPFQVTNSCFSGTVLVSGSAVGVVVATGLKTALGSIAQLIQHTERESTFSKNIYRLSKFIIFMVLITLGLVVIAHLLLKRAVLFDAKFFTFMIALAVTIIPELLPTVVTFCLSQGARMLAKRKVVVKRLSAVEDLGSIQVLCTDKTGTLTENKLTVADLLAEDKASALFFAALVGTENSQVNKKHTSSAFDEALFLALSDDEKKRLSEYALVIEVPFEPARRRSSVIKKRGEQAVLAVRGAYEELQKCSINLDAQKKEEMARWVATQGEQGRRVIGVAMRELAPGEADAKAAEKDLTFLGIVALEDPIKQSSFSAIQEAQKLGVQVKILTGDSPEVAGYVGTEIGITTYMQDVITGDFFAELSPEQKKEVAMRHAIFARIAPAQKYEIIQLLQEKYEVGFLGDGINDAPALKIANVAIVVEGAADIAQDAADIVLLDKSLHVIVEGIKEGRKIFANTVKYLKVSIASNFGNFYGLSVASMIIDYLPMLPLQLLLANILSDLPMVSIATDNVDEDELKSPESYNLRDIALIAMVLGVVSTVFDFIFFAMFYRQHEPAILQTGWFMGSVLTELFFIISIRSRGLFFMARPPSLMLLFGLLATALATVIVPYTFIGQEFFHFTALSSTNMMTILGIVGAYFVTTELVKMVYYRVMGLIKKS